MTAAAGAGDAAGNETVLIVGVVVAETAVGLGEVPKEVGGRGERERLWRAVWAEGGWGESKSARVSMAFSSSSSRSEGATELERREFDDAEESGRCEGGTFSVGERDVRSGRPRAGWEDMVRGLDDGETDS